MTFKVGDKVKSVAPGDDKRWRGIVIQNGVGQVKIRRSSDKKGDQYWITTTYLVKV